MIGTVYCMRKAIEYFKRCTLLSRNQNQQNTQSDSSQPKEKCIVSISGGGATGARAFFLGYALAKTGVVRATETLAKEVENDGIRINCIAPGAMNTNMTEEIIAAGQSAGEEYTKALKQKEKGGTPLNKAAQLAVYLSSDKSKGITGRLISAVWDDWQNLEQHKDEIKESDVYTLRRIIPSDRGFTWKE